MEKTEILVVGRNPEIVQTVIRLINNNPSWNATPAVTDLDAVSLFQSRPFTLVLLGGGIEPKSDTYFAKHLLLIIRISLSYSTMAVAAACWPPKSIWRWTVCSKKPGPGSTEHFFI